VNIVPTVCPYGCRYFNEGWHAENCPGPSTKSGASRWYGEPGVEPSSAGSAPAPAFLSDPEYQREREADELERRREEAEDVRTIYPERGITE
jgi:hypothetical protein